jgi:hypothetical protein
VHEVTVDRGDAGDCSVRSLQRGFRAVDDSLVAKILFLLTVASVAVAMAALTVQVATNNDLSAAVIAALVPAAVTLLTGCVLYGLFFSPRLLKPRGE